MTVDNSETMPRLPAVAWEPPVSDPVDRKVPPRWALTRVEPTPNPVVGPAPEGRWEAPARRLLDVVLAGLALLLVGLPMVLIALLIRIDSSGPALFRQERVGRDRRPFMFYKFRTMGVGVGDAEHRKMIAAEIEGEDTSVNGSWKPAADRRITRIGGFLRRTSLDELPQLFNVLRGQMTLVGPRPCLAWEADMFPREYADRFAVVPGLTGLWQVSGRSTMSTLEMLDLDVRYVRTRTFATDLRLILKTLPALLRDDGAR